MRSLFFDRQAPVRWFLALFLVAILTTALAGNVALAAPSTASNAAPYGERWIDVNLSTQTLTAYQGRTPVFSTLVSTGTRQHPTVVGTFRVYVKLRATLMTGGSRAAGDYYYLPNVPYTMYFYGGYAIHGTYWHNNFGHQMSHGCVNLPTSAAAWVFSWASVGTRVVSHY